MKKITYLALHLGFGGVEKAIINQANILSEFCQVEIISAYKLYDKPPFWIDSRVSVRYLMDDKPNKDELKQAIQSKNPIRILKEGIHAMKILSKRTSLMKQAIQKCDSSVIISSRYLYNQLLIKNARNGTITIAQEHCHHNGNDDYIQKLTKSVAEMDFFMPVSKELTDFYAQKLNGEKVKCVYIPHNLDYWPDTSSKLIEKKLVAVGRLSPEKGFLDLIDVLEPVMKTFPDWSLHIIGDGIEKNSVQSRITSFGLEQQMIVHGFQDKDFVNQMLSTSSIYVMASLEESFGIVLIEAQSHGLPCVAFDSAQGANEIIENKQTGYLVANRNKEQFVDCVEKLIESQELRSTMGEKARISAQKYKQDVVKDAWHSFIDTIEQKEQML